MTFQPSINNIISIHRYFYFMILSRNQFFLLLFLISVIPFYAFKINWLAQSELTNGRMWFRGYTLEPLGNISAHLVIKYKVGNDSLDFAATNDAEMNEEDIVSVRYQTNNPKDAKINSFKSIWLDSILYSIGPLLVVLILFLTPDKFDPLIPKKSKIIIRKKPFIEIVR